MLHERVWIAPCMTPSCFLFGKKTSPCPLISPCPWRVALLPDADWSRSSDTGSSTGSYGRNVLSVQTKQQFKCDVTSHKWKLPVTQRKRPSCTRANCVVANAGLLNISHKVQESHSWQKAAWVHLVRSTPHMQQPLRSERTGLENTAWIFVSNRCKLDKGLLKGSWSDTVLFFPKCDTSGVNSHATFIKINCNSNSILKRLVFVVATNKNWLYCSKFPLSVWNVFLRIITEVVYFHIHRFTLHIMHLK